MYVGSLSTSFPTRVVCLPLSCGLSLGCTTTWLRSIRSLFHFINVKFIYGRRSMPCGDWQWTSYNYRTSITAIMKGSISRENKLLWSKFYDDKHVMTQAHRPHDSVHFHSWDLNQILLYDFKRSHVKLNIGRISEDRPVPWGTQLWLGVLCCTYVHAHNFQ